MLGATRPDAQPDATCMTGGDGDKKVSGMAGSEPDQAAGRRPPWWAGVAAVALVMAVPVATWWLVGDQTDPELLRRLQAFGGEPYYTVRPLDIAPAAERAVGVVAVVLVVAAVVVLVGAWLTGHLHVGWWGVLGVLSLVGAGWGFMWAGPGFCPDLRPRLEITQGLGKVRE